MCLEGRNDDWKNTFNGQSNFRTYGTSPDRLESGYSGADERL